MMWIEFSFHIWHTFQQSLAIDLQILRSHRRKVVHLHDLAVDFTNIIFLIFVEHIGNFCDNVQSLVASPLGGNFHGVCVSSVSVESQYLLWGVRWKDCYLL